ncbi:hypothetical protein BS333_09410 [Vibrio azureus]|uniref:Phage tail fibre protein N-terminal domain-containing protein n=2 Tax=Vibrio azureus TaxID=512649 RepID=U3C9R3_9VIBR|nr:phage tail protein [Vibrio azureus]AUI86580.1 hypothetical protein BS333_09410 [Vibrio azureus]GAD78099.1 hypothetical protein VAZ01S_124_00030 [Vibrio azureus NBRC 104587]
MAQSIITREFEAYKAQQDALEQPVILDEFVLAKVPGLDPDEPIDRDETLPEREHIVYVAGVTQSGYVNPNAVVYSLIMDTRVGDFQFNWVGLRNKETGLLGAILHLPELTKYQSIAGVQNGNAITRSILMSYEGAQRITGITVDASTWQIDFTARLFGLDEMDRLANLDVLGPAAFLDEGFKVVPTEQGFQALAGCGYVGGLRCYLDEPHALPALTLPCRLYLDATWKGQPTSQWHCEYVIRVAETLTDFHDEDGYAHFVAPIAEINAQGEVTDLRFLEGFAQYYRQKHVDRLLDTKIDKAAITDSTSDASSEKVASAKAVKDVAEKVQEAIAQTETKLPKAGGTMTGNIRFIDNQQGIVWERNTDGAFIRFKNDSDQDTDSFLEFGTLDNGNEFFKWTIDGIERASLKSDGFRVANTIFEGGTALSNKYLGKTGKAADADKLDGVDSSGFARAYSSSHGTGGGHWSTAQLVSWLKSKGCFNHPYWMMKASWDYAGNRLISDTGCGKIHLAGCVIEVMGRESAYTIRVTTPTTSSGGGTTNAVFTYTNHGPGYHPSWRRDFNTRQKPTAGDIGALTQAQGDARYLGKTAKASSATISDKIKIYPSSTTNFHPIVWNSVNMLYTTNSGSGMSYRPSDGFSKIKHGQMAGYYLTHDTSGKIKPANDNRRSAGMYGLYNSHKIAHIWSMGEAYKIHDRGANFGNLHGLAYKHTNNGTGGTMAGGHQAVWCENGSPKAAMGSHGLWGQQVFDGAGNNRQRVYSPNNPPPAPPPGVKWVKVASGSLNHRLLSHSNAKRETVVTNFPCSGGRHHTNRFKVVITTSGSGVVTHDIPNCWWSAKAVIHEERTRWSGAAYVTFDVYTTGANILNGPTWGKVTGWELWELK